MYLTRVEIDRNNRKKTRDLTHAGAYHNWVEQSFPEEWENKERSRKLWRLDTLQGKPYLLLVSRTKPDAQALEKYGVEGSVQTKSYQPFLDTLHTGQKARFRVTLNPVIALAQKEGRGRVVPHVTAQQQVQFLADRAENNGFSLEEDNYGIVERGYVEFHRSGQRPIRLSKASYEGILTITEEDTFRRLLTEGMGKKKAYGFGLMTVIPIRP